ncbi:hypothetical protein [Zoogloea sp.]|uniref:hypothetical protein n=1 Tax=Zoogloea sp. TaxID=49181 RepID=UPI0035AD7712
MKMIKGFTLGLLTALIQTGMAHAGAWNLARDMMTQNITNSGATDSAWTLYQDSDMSGNSLKYVTLPLASTCQWGTTVLNYTCWQISPTTGVMAGVTKTANIFPKGSVIVHPRMSRGAVVGWKTPAEGSFKIIYAVSDMHTTCGDGISWNLRYQGVVQKSGSIVNGGFTNGTLNLSLQAGESVYLTIGANGTELCDSTAVEMQVLSQ